MLRVYLDANAVIYYVERHSTIYPLLKQRMVAADGAPLIHCVSSELVRLEVRVLPLRNANTSLLARFDEFFTTFSAHAVHLDRQVFDLATELRAQFKLNTPDALHLAAAFVAGCDEFWTNDKGLAKGAPALIMNSGLVPTLAFYNGKGRVARRLLDDLIRGRSQRLAGQELRAGQGSQLFPEFMEMLQRVESRDNLRHTDEALELLKWIRQFVYAVAPAREAA